MAETSEARKRREEREAAASPWTAVLMLDGEPVCGPVPCDLYDAAAILSPLVAGWLGGPVSVAKAVAAMRPVPDAQTSLFAEVDQ